MGKLFVITLGLVALGSVALAQPNGSAAPAPAPAYRVIVNGKNPAITVTKEFLSTAYLKKVTRWRDGELIQPVDLSSDSPVRKRFVEEVLGRTISALRSYWQQLIFSGRGIPPVELDNDAAVVQYVTTHRGAVGYVSGTADIGSAKAVRVQ